MSNLEEDHALSALKEPLQPVSLCRLAINLADDFQPLGWDRNIQITVVDSGFADAPDVLAMKPLISQVFSNVIENAIKYSDSNSHIRITGKYDKHNDVVLVSISNKGIPLPNPASSIFDRGFRSEAAKNKYPAGTGFGLYIAKRIVELHEGRISAKMQDGEAVFTVVLSVKGLEGKARFRESKDRSTR